MKKISALLLAAIMSLSLFACDNTQTEIEESDTVIENQEQPEDETPAEPEEKQTEETTDEEPVEEEIPVEENTQEEETEEPAVEEQEETVTEEQTETLEDSEEETKPAFDNTWTSNEFESLLPKIPFSGWTTSKESDNVYEMELGGLKTSVLTDSNGNNIGYEEDKQTILDYIEALKGYGFTVEETGGIENFEYEWEIKDAHGNEIEITCSDGYCWITITKK